MTDVIKNFGGEGLARPWEDILQGIPKVSTLNEMAGGLFNFFLAFAGVVAVIFIIVGAFYIITDAGTGEGITKGRKAIMGSVIGLILIFASFAIVTTFMSINVGTRGAQRPFVSNKVVFYYQVTNNLTRAITGKQVSTLIIARNEDKQAISELGDGSTVQLLGNNVFFSCLDIIDYNTTVLNEPEVRVGVKCGINNVVVWFENT